MGLCRLASEDTRNCKLVSSNTLLLSSFYPCPTEFNIAWHPIGNQGKDFVFFRLKKNVNNLVRHFYLQVRSQQQKDTTTKDVPPKD